MRSPFALGLDFGTTNSALATVDASGATTVLPLPAPDGSTRRYWRTVLCFEPASASAARIRVTARSSSAAVSAPQ